MVRWPVWGTTGESLEEASQQRVRPNAESESTMTVSELKAMLDELPSDMEILVNHERVKLAAPELFLAYKYVSVMPELVIVAAGTSALEDAQTRDYWRHLQKP
jgi:hypothetical protein